MDFYETTIVVWNNNTLCLNFNEYCRYFSNIFNCEFIVVFIFVWLKLLICRNARLWPVYSFVWICNVMIPKYLHTPAEVMKYVLWVLWIEISCANISDIEVHCRRKSKFSKSLQKLLKIHENGADCSDFNRLICSTFLWKSIWTNSNKHLLELRL